MCYDYNKYSLVLSASFSLSENYTKVSACFTIQAIYFWWVPPNKHTTTTTKPRNIFYYSVEPPWQLSFSTSSLIIYIVLWIQCHFQASTVNPLYPHLATEQNHLCTQQFYSAIVNFLTAKANPQVEILTDQNIRAKHGLCTFYWMLSI